MNSMLAYVFTTNKPSDKACPITFRPEGYAVLSNATGNNSTTAGADDSSLSIERVQAAVILSVILPVLLLTTILVEYLAGRLPVDEEEERKSGNRTAAIFRLTLHPSAVEKAKTNEEL